MEGPRVAKVPNSRDAETRARLSKYLQPSQASLT